MEFKIQKNEFLRGLYLASGIADRKSTLPILANVLLRTEGKGKLLCAATDLSVTTVVTLSAKVEKEGGLTVSARQLHEIVKGLPDDEVLAFSTESLDLLADRDVKAIVVACNTSTAVALGALRRRYDVPILGVIAWVRVTGAAIRLEGVLRRLLTTGPSIIRHTRTLGLDFDSTTLAQAVSLVE